VWLPNDQIIVGLCMVWYGMVQGFTWEFRPTKVTFAATNPSFHSSTTTMRHVGICQYWQSHNALDRSCGPMALSNAFLFFML
jgi:hypothetical protein